MASSSPPPGTDDDGSDEDVYVVKRILAEEGTDEERLFLIEWEGYPLEESTWEPEENVLSKETLKAWKEEKLRQREGLSQPLDTDEFDKRQEEYARRKRTREKLGLPELSKPSEPESNGYSSSDEAEESYVEVPDFEGIPFPKKSRQTRVKRNDTTFRDDDTVMNDASDESDAPAAARYKAPKPAREVSTSEDRHRKESRPTKNAIGTKVNVHKAPIIEAPSATGYQGTAHRGPIPPRSDIAPGGRSVRGKPRTTGRGSHMATTKLRAPRTIESRILTNTHLKAAKAPQLFVTKSMERRFELGARALADRPPAQIPRLINPAEYVTQSRIRKRGSAPVPGGAQGSQTPVSAPGGQQPVSSVTAAMAPMVTSPEELLPQWETTTAETGIDPTGHTTGEPHRPPNTRKVSFAEGETDRDEPYQKSPKASPVVAFHLPTAPMGFTSASPVHSHPANSGARDLPSAPVKKVSLANYSAKQSGITPKPVSMFDHAQSGLSETTLKSFLGDRHAHDDPIMLKFIDVDVQSADWGAWLQQLQSKGLAFNHICRSTDVDNLKSEFNPTLLARGRVTAATGDDRKGQESISALADYLRVNISGLLYNLETHNIIIYPTRCEEWKFIEFGIQLQHSGQLSFFSFTTLSKIVCHSYNRDAENRMAKMKVDGYEDYPPLNRAMFGFSYQSLHQVDKKSNRDLFFLLFPNMAAPLAVHTASWLRSSNNECRIYTCQEAGSWRQFVRYTTNPEGGSLIIHHKMMPLIPRYPKLQEFLLNGLNNVWCIDEDFPQGKYLLRLFPHGGAVCLTSGFLSGEPEMALYFLNWFLPKRESRASTGTWKLLVCNDVFKFVSGQAFGAAKRRAELLGSLPQGLTNSQKETLATSSGLSMKHCQDRLDLMDVVGKLVHAKNERERDLDAVLQADQSRSLMVFADESIKPSDDCGLIRYFAYWSVLRLESFRKFVAIGSNSSPEEHEEVDTQAEGSSSATDGAQQAQEPGKSNSSSPNPPSDRTSQDRPTSKIPRKSRWKRDAFASVDGAIDDHDTESADEQYNENGRKATSSSPAEPTIEPRPDTSQTLEAGDLATDIAPEEPDRDGIDDSIDPEILRLINQTGAEYSEAAEFMGRAKGNHDLAVKLFNYSEEVKRKAEEAEEAAAGMPKVAKTPPAPPSPHVTEANSAIPSTEDVTTEDIVMEDAPPAAPEVASSDPQPADANAQAQNNDPDAKPSSQTSNAGIITSESGIRLVPRSMRVSGTVRKELNIRPGYVPPEDKEVYKVRRDRSASLGRASVSRSRSGSRGVEEKKEGDGAVSWSPGGVLTPVTPATPSEWRKDMMGEIEGAQGGEMGGKLNTLEWYAERKLKGEEWNHIAVVGWEDAFRLLRVDYKK